MTTTEVGKEEPGRRWVSATEAKCFFSDLIAGVRYRGERVVITKHGRPIAEIVPVDDPDAEAAS